MLSYTRLNRVAGLLLFGWISLAACTVTEQIERTPTHKIATATPETIATSTSTSQPAEIVTPTPTDVPKGFPDEYELPGWMSQPETIIVAGVSDWIDGIFQLSFFNADTDERFDILLPAEILGYFWLDNQHFGFLTTDDQIIHILDTQTGGITTDTLFTEVTRFISRYRDDGPLALIKFQPNAEKHDFILTNASRVRDFSVDWAYKVFEHRDDNEWSISVLEVNTEATMQITDSTDGLWDAFFQWSPINADQLAVAQREPAEFLIIGDRITIYDVVTQEILSTNYVGDFWYGFDWSPDGSQILYPRLNSPHSTKSTPCIFNLHTEETACIHNIPNTHILNKYEGEGTGLYRWSPDGAYVFYTYYYYDLSIDKHYVGGFCTYNLRTGNITCLTDDIPELIGNTVTGYAVSPDGQYVVLHYECRDIVSDSACDPMNALLKMDGSGFRLLINPALSEKQLRGDVNFIMDNYVSASAYAWRPHP